MISKKTILLLAILIASIVSSLYFDTSIFFNQPTVKTFRAYWRVYPEDYWISDYAYLTILPERTTPNYTITDIVLPIDNPFIDSTISFGIRCENFSYVEDFAIHIDENTIVANDTKILEYEKNNQPDIMLNGSYLKKPVLAWSQVWNSWVSINNLDVECNALFEQTSYDTWEGNLLLDTASETSTINNVTYAQANLRQIVLSVKIPSNYIIENPQNYKITEDQSGNSLVYEEVTPTQTFHIIVVDKNRQSSKTLGSIIGATGIGVPSIIFGIFTVRWYEKQAKPKRGYRKVERHLGGLFGILD